MFAFQLAKASFFDRQKLIDATSKAERKNLGWFGGAVRKRARFSMRRRKGISKAGDPPFAHAGQVRDLLFYAYDQTQRSVVIGPVPFKAGQAPHLLEYGGTIKRGRKTYHYQARPFMRPAFAAEYPRLKDKWKDSIRSI
jgi:hypothetical protein